jgi:hypothetical protein
MSAVDTREREGEGPGSGKDRKGGSPLLGILVIAITLALTAFSYHSYATNASQGRGKALLRAAEAVGPSCVPLHLAVTCGEGSILAVKASLRDLGGREIALQEKAFPGSQVSIDFLLVPAGKAAKDGGRLVLAFPRSVYSDVLPQNEGMRLLPSYADRSFPGVFDGSPAAAALSPADRKAVAEAMASLARADADPSGSPARALGVQLCTITLPVVPGTFEYDLEAKGNGSITARPSR